MKFSKEVRNVPDYKHLGFARLGIPAMALSISQEGLKKPLKSLKFHNPELVRTLPLRSSKICVNCLTEKLSCMILT